MHTKQDKPQNAAEVLKFFDWAFKNGQKMADELDYVPMPDARGQGDRRRLEGADQGRLRQADLELTRYRRIAARIFLRPPKNASPAASHRSRPVFFEGLSCRDLRHRCLAARHDRRRWIARAAREPDSAGRAARRAAVAGLAVRAHDAVLRAVRAARCCVGDPRRAGCGPRSRRSQKFGFGVLRHQRLESGDERVRRAGADLRHARHVGDRAADRRAGELRHRAVPDRDVPGRRCKRPLGTAIELLAAIPSIIYGMWGLFVFAPFFGDYVQPLLHAASSATCWILGPLFQGAPNGIGMLSAGIILSIMVIPFIASVMRDVFEIVPPVLKESAYGIGARRGKWSGTSCCPTPRSASSAASCSASAARSARRWR